MVVIITDDRVNMKAWGVRRVGKMFGQIDDTKAKQVIQYS